MNMCLKQSVVKFILIVISRREYMFNFNDKFEILDDSEVLKQLGMLMGLLNIM